MNLDDFAKMIGSNKYKKVDKNKFENATELRKYREEDIENIYIDKEKTKLKKFEFVFEPKTQKEEEALFNACEEHVKSKDTYDTLKNTIFSTSSHQNKPGAFLYKGDHLWTYYGKYKVIIENKVKFEDFKMTFLMTHCDDKTCTFQFLHKFVKNNMKNYFPYEKEITDKWATLQERWFKFLEEKESESGEFFKIYFKIKL
jgi:hypothetical protein